MVVATVSDGVVSTVNSKTPDNSGNVALTGGDIPMGTDDSTALSAAIGAKLSSAAGAVGTDNLGDGVVTAEKIAAGAVQMPTQGLTAEADLADDDSFPFYASSAGANKRTLWSNIVTKLKSLFLPLTGGTMTGNVLVERNSGAYVKVLNSLTGAACSLYATDDSNAGLLMEHAGKWLIRYDGANVHINEKQYHPITAGTAAPSGGSDGDIYLKYT